MLCPAERSGRRLLHAARSEYLRGHAETSSEGLRGQVLAVEGDDGALAALGIGDLLHIELEVDRADNSVADSCTSALRVVP
jgi:hypothetical protein